MRAQFDPAIDPVPQFPDATLAWGEPRQYASAAEPGFGPATRASLAQEHRDLDDIITVLSQYSPSDGSLISRLKKRKLHIKDELARLAGIQSG